MSHPVKSFLWGGRGSCRAAPWGGGGNHRQVSPAGVDRPHSNLGSSTRTVRLRLGGSLALPV